jgi:hypothetical protein
MATECRFGCRNCEQVLGAPSARQLSDAATGPSTDRQLLVVRSISRIKESDALR